MLPMKILRKILKSFPTNYSYIKRKLLKEQILVLNKQDLVDESDLKELEIYFQQLEQNVITVSGATGEGIDALKELVVETLELSEIH